MKHFTIAELCRSNTAAAKKIDNTPTEQVEQNLKALVENVLDPVREKSGRPIVVNCGYRSPALNKAVGGVSNSQHVTGEAADIESDNNLVLAKTIYKLGVFDQLILEFPDALGEPGWVHVSYSQRHNRKQVFVAKKINGKTKYLPYEF